MKKMSLQERLEKFQKQQEKCLSTLTSIASAKQTSTKASTPPKMNSNALKETPSSVQPPAPAVRFSNDTDRLQFINSIRKSPAGAQLKRVIDLLLERREALTLEQIDQACYVDVLGNKTVFESLKNNPKVHYDGKHFSYKAKHEVNNKEHLLILIRKFPEGMPVIDLKDSYSNVEEDLQTLKTDRKVWLLSNIDSQEDIVYPNYPRVPIKVDVDLKKLFRSIELPRDFLDVEKELLKSGVKPLTNTAQRTAAQIHGISSKPKPKKKKHEISKRSKLTNSHMPELFGHFF